VIRNESKRIALTLCGLKAVRGLCVAFQRPRRLATVTRFSGCLAARFCFAVAVVLAMLRKFHLDVIANVFQDQHWQL